MITTDKQVNDLSMQAKVYFAQAQEILLKADCSAEDMEKAEGLTNQAQQLKTRASKLVELSRMSGENHDSGNGSESPSEFKTWKEFTTALAVAHKSRGRSIDPRLELFAEKDLSGTGGASGGYLIPPQSMNQLMSIAAPMQIVRSRATNIDMSSRQVDYPAVDQTATVAGVANFFGGVQTYWQDEGSTITKSDPKFRNGKLTAHELVGSTVVNNSLLDDAPALASFLGGSLGFPGAIAWEEDYAFLRGTGVGKPLGVVNAPATKVVTRTTASTIKYDDLANIEAGFMGETGVWVASIAAKATLLLMNGPSGNASYLWGNAAQGVPSTLLGRPIVFTDKLPGVGTKGDIGLYDFRYYLVGNRLNATSVELDASENFSKNKTAFRIIHRVDGQPWISAPVTLFDGSTTISPFVVLNT